MSIDTANKGGSINVLADPANLFSHMDLKLEYTWKSIAQPQDYKLKQ